LLHTVVIPKERSTSKAGGSVGDSPTEDRASGLNVLGGPPAPKRAHMVELRSATAYDVHMADNPRGTSSVLAAREREDINRIAATHGARNVRVFGSVGRGEATSSSDLDLLVDMSEGRSLLDLVALGDDLEEALGVAVDVVTEKSLSPYLRDRILAEAVSL
jgi:uncharacterized protein